MYKSMIKKNAKYLLIPAFCLYVYGKYSYNKDSSVKPSVSLNNIFDDDNDNNSKIII